MVDIHPIAQPFLPYDPKQANESLNGFIFVPLAHLKWLFSGVVWKWKNCWLPCLRVPRMLLSHREGPTERDESRSVPVSTCMQAFTVRTIGSAQLEPPWEQQKKKDVFFFKIQFFFYFFCVPHLPSSRYNKIFWYIWEFPLEIWWLAAQIVLSGVFTLVSSSLWMCFFYVFIITFCFFLTTFFFWSKQIGCLSITSLFQTLGQPNKNKKRNLFCLNE